MPAVNLVCRSAAKVHDIVHGVAVTVGVSSVEISSGRINISYIQDIIICTPVVVPCGVNLICVGGKVRNIQSVVRGFAVFSLAAKNVTAVIVARGDVNGIAGLVVFHFRAGDIRTAEENRRRRAVRQNFERFLFAEFHSKASKLFHENHGAIVEHMRLLVRQQNFIGVLD